jgi:hypothetical protein
VARAHDNAAQRAHSLLPRRAGYAGSVDSSAAKRSDRIAEPWGSRTPFPAGEHWPIRVDTHLEGGVSADEVEWFRSASILHSNGDELDIAVREGRIVGVRGDRHSRVNQGWLGPKDL